MTTNDVVRQFMGRRFRLWGSVPLAVLFLVLTASWGSAAEITVRQDGTGDYFTISDGVGAASPYDTVTVGPGTYVEPLVEIDIALPMLLRSQAGPEMTVVSGAGVSRHAQITANATIEGFTFTNGHAMTITDAGGSLFISEADVQITNCNFDYNTADAGGALYVRVGTATISQCTFTGNNAPTIGGAVDVVVGGTAIVDQCTFVNNSTDIWGGAINVGSGSALNVSGSLFQENTSGDVAGAIYVYDASALIETSTFWRNHSPGPTSASVTIQASPSVVVSRNIVAQDTGGYGVQFYRGEGIHTCNIYFNNSRGNLEGGALSWDEREVDPRFCGPSWGNFGVTSDSPATADNSPCSAQIGAFGVACSAVAVREVNWGQVKFRYLTDDGKQ